MVELKRRISSKLASLVIALTWRDESTKREWEAEEISGNNQMRPLTSHKVGHTLPGSCGDWRKFMNRSQGKELLHEMHVPGDCGVVTIYPSGVFGEGAKNYSLSR